MSYRAIYAYAWDVAERGVDAFVAEISRARPRYGDACRRLPRRQVHPPAGQGGQSLFPRRRHRLFPGRSGRYGAIEPVAEQPCRASGMCCASFARRASR